MVQSSRPDELLAATTSSPLSPDRKYVTATGSASSRLPASRKWPTSSVQRSRVSRSTRSSVLSNPTRKLSSSSTTPETLKTMPSPPSQTTTTTTALTTSTAIQGFTIKRCLNFLFHRFPHTSKTLPMLI